MSEQNVTLEMLEKRIELIHRIDDIRDDGRDLRDALRLSLKTLALATDADAAYVRYVDAYGVSRTRIVDTHGIIQRETRPAIDELESRLSPGQDYTRMSPEETSTDDYYFAVPMTIGTQRIGLLGFSKSLLAGDNEKSICVEAARILDSMIVADNRYQLEKDKNEVSTVIDDLLDSNPYDLEHCLGDVLRYLIDKLDAIAGFIFGAGGEELTVWITNETGTIVWNNYEEVRYLVMEVVQAAQYSEQKHVTNLTYGDVTVGNSPVRGLVAIPLVTTGGDNAGTIAFVCKIHVNDNTADLVARASSVFDTAIISDKHSRFMAKRFGKYVGSEVISALVANPDWLSPRDEDVAVISVDLCGSTKFASGQTDALMVFKHINKYLRKIAGIVKNEYHGTVDKFIGDEIMALFGAPVRDKNCHNIAVECALDIVRRIEAYNRELKSRDEPHFEIKTTVGLVHAVIGEVGSEDTQTDYTIIGSDVNSFFRIADYAEPGRILVNAALNDMIKSRYDTELFGTMPAKGLDDGVEIFELPVN